MTASIITDSDANAVITLENIKGGTISGSPGTFILRPPNYNGISIKNCENLTLQYCTIISCGLLRYRLIKKLIGLIGWKAFLFGEVS
jgi:hypothetical protein